jgi:hypothetical protein
MVTCRYIPDATSIVYKGMFDIHDAGAEAPERGDNGDNVVRMLHPIFLYMKGADR